MRNRLLITLALSLVAFASQAALPPFRLDPKEYIPVSQVKPGMAGYGLTVFSGVKIERFHVRVISVMPQQNMGRPMVLIRMSGGPITARQANIIQGMSGSPVYINGRLLGAVSAGYPNPNEPVAFVTPIEDMIDAFDPRLPDRPLYADAWPPLVGGEGVSTELNKLLSGPSLSESAFTPRPTVPLFASGFGPRSMNVLNAALEPFGVRAMAGTGAAGRMTSDGFPKGIRLQPGSAIGVSLMQGDVDLTGIGTVTYRKGDRILAFGHPMLMLGPAEFPANTAFIHDVFSSRVTSFKLGSSIETVGTILQDRPFSVGGLLKRMPRMVPMTITVNDKNTGQKQVYKIRMVNHPALLPSLVVSGATEVIGRLRPYPGDAMATATFTVVPENLAPITRTNRYYDPVAINAGALTDLTESLLILSRNPFEPVRIKSVNMTVDLENGHQTAVVERAWIEKDAVEPGDTITVQAVVKPFKKPSEMRTLSVTIPENAPVGQAQVVVFGGNTGMRAAPSPSGAASGASVVNVRQLVDKFLERERNDEIGLRVMLPGSAVTVDGERLGSLPEHLASVMKSTKASSTRLERDEIRYAESTPYVLSGQQMLVVNIARKSATEKAPSTTPKPAEPEEEEADATTTASVRLTVPASADPDELMPSATELRRVIIVPASAVAKAAEKPAETARPAESKETKPEADDKSDGTSPGRQARMWKQTTKAAFDKADVTSATVSSDGSVQLTASLEPLARTTRPYIWSLLPMSDGSVMAGTGNGGEVLKVEPDGKLTVLSKTDALGIHSLARDAYGNVYAGTSPAGKILKIGPTGVATTFAETGEKYIFALTASSSGTLYAGTGPNGQVLSLDTSGKSKVLADLPETHVLSLAVHPDGSLLAGTSPDGLVYRISPDGTARVQYDTAETGVSALASDAAGNVYAATAPSSKVYRIRPDGQVDVLLEKPDGDVLALAATGDGILYAAGGKKIYRITPDKTVTTLDSEDQNQFVSLAFAADRSLLAGSANIGVIYRSAPGREGTLLSSVHDAGLRAAWGRMEWMAGVPDGATLEFQTRSGNVADPDDTWSAWTPVTGERAGPIQSPPARYLQYKAVLKPSPSGETPELRGVMARYLTDNRPPTVKFSVPKEPVRWTGKQTVKWTGTDPDSDRLTYDLYLTADEGRTWTPLKDAVKKPEPPAAAPQPKGNGDEKQASKAEPSDPKAAKPEEKKPAAEDKKDEDKDDKPNDTLRNSYSWSTDSVPDGHYRLKITATDRASNPGTALAAEEMSVPILISNAKPAITTGDTPVVEGRRITLSGEATTGLTAIVGVSYRVNKGDWLAVLPADGIFDSPKEAWTLTTDELPAGEQTIDVRAVDEVNSAATTTVKVTVK